MELICRPHGNGRCTQKLRSDTVGLAGEKCKEQQKKGVVCADDAVGGDEQVTDFAPETGKEGMLCVPVFSSYTCASNELSPLEEGTFTSTMNPESAVSSLVAPTDASSVPSGPWSEAPLDEQERLNEVLTLHGDRDGLPFCAITEQTSSEAPQPEPNVSDQTLDNVRSSQRMPTALPAKRRKRDVLKAGVQRILGQRTLQCLYRQYGTER